MFLEVVIMPTFKNILKIKKNHKPIDEPIPESTASRSLFMRPPPLPSLLLGPPPLMNLLLA